MYSNKHNSWEPVGGLDHCKDTIQQFEQAHTTLALINDAGPAAHCLQPEEEVERQAAVIFGPNDIDAKTAVRRLMNRQGLDGSMEEYLPGSGIAMK